MLCAWNFETKSSKHLDGRSSSSSLCKKKCFPADLFVSHQGGSRTTAMSRFLCSLALFAACYIGVCLGLVEHSGPPPETVVQLEDRCPEGKTLRSPLQRGKLVQLLYCGFLSLSSNLFRPYHACKHCHQIVSVACQSLSVSEIRLLQLWVECHNCCVSW